MNDAPSTPLAYNAACNFMEFVEAHNEYERLRRVERGKDFKEIRPHLALTQRRLAEILGVDHTYVSKIEHGQMPVSPEVASQMLTLWKDDRAEYA